MSRKIEDQSMEVVLNIGLDNVPADLSYTIGVLNPLNVRRALQAAQAVRAHGFKVISAKVKQSDTEPTLVVEATHTGLGLDNTIDMLSAALKQDCIGVWYPAEQYGQLIGPKADAWGDFNHEFFIMPDGTRLAPPAAKAA